MIYCSVVEPRNISPKYYSPFVAQHCSFVEPKHLSVQVDANIYARIEAKCLSVEETHYSHISEGKCFSSFEMKHAMR